jgi:uncharacterized protein YndB with AHSA1/START domain
MVTTASPHDVTLTITRHFHAPVQKVFRAWTDPRVLTKWFAPSDLFSVPHAEMDLQIGGRYRIEIHAPDGAVSTVSGLYREIRPAKRLVFTWAWEEGGSAGPSAVGGRDTVVTVQFHDRDRVTDVILTHEQFATPEERHAHHERWTTLLNRLPHALPHH